MEKGEEALAKVSVCITVLCLTVYRDTLATLNEFRIPEKQEIALASPVFHEEITFYFIK